MALEQTIDDMLLVEDNDGDAKLLELTLRDESFTGVARPDDVTRVRTLAAAFEELDEHDYDVVFLDLGLPDSSGLETVDRLMEVEPDVPVIVLTGLNDQERALQSIQRGAQDYLVKGELTGDSLARSVRYAIERRKQTQELRRKKEQMQFFNSILRHDMLNGMNVIRMRAELLEESLDGDEAASVESIIDWSDDIIDLTEKVRSVLETLTSGEDPELGPVDLVPTVEAEAERVRGMGEDVTVETDLPDSVTVLADDLLSDVVGNVLTNAVEHATDDDGVDIAVTVAAADGSARVEIADDGPGIPAQERKRVFERGRTGSQSTGTGFGLYFVAAMVNTYDGTVDVGDSDRGGAEIAIELPTA